MRTFLLTAALFLLSTGPGLAGTSSTMCDDPPCTKHEVQAYERRVGRHMLRTQKARFEASARGEKKKSARYDREFKRTQQRWFEAKRALATTND
jgi:hypothetical protein